jgi:hypothetical protein
MQQDAATPSSIGYTIGYDLDGILKQKDQNGVVTPVGAVSTQRLDQTLKYGNNSGTYSIIMGTATSFRSINGTGRIALDYGSTSSVYISVTSSTITSSLQNSLSAITFTYNKSTSQNSIVLSDNSLVTQVGTTTYSVKINQSGDNLSITHNDSNIGANGTIKIFETGKTYDGIGSENKAFVHINAKGATTSRGVQNSVVIGGNGLTASRSNTVYLGNSVNINNAFTLPNVDGLTNQILRTNGSGTVSWATFSISGVPLSTVLSVGNNSATYSIIIGSGSSIIMGTGTSIKSEINTNQIDLNYNDTEKSILLSTDNGSKGQTYLQIASSSTSLKTNILTITSTSSTITVTDGTGLQYSTDYSSTFTNESLITKRYVDANSGSHLSNKKVYVDVVRGNNSTALVDRVDKPYSDIATAILGLTSSYGTFTQIEPGLIYIKKGEYTDVAPLMDYINYYCEENVVFTQNGFTDLNIPVTSNVYGYASFIGTDSSLTPLSIDNNSVVNFEFDKIDTKQNALKIKGDSNVTAKGNYIKTLSESGYTISVEGGANLNVFVRDGILGAYETIFAKNGFSGNLYIDSPYIRVNGNLGTSGVQSGLVNALIVSTSTTGTIKIKGDLENISTTFGGNNAAANIGSGTIVINGKLNGGVANGLYLTNGITGDVTINGDITSQIESIVGLSNTITLKVNNSVIKTQGLGTYPNNIYINSSGSFYISNSTIYNTLTDASLINIVNVNSVLGVYNSLGYSPGTTGSFAFSATPCDVGFHNTRSSNDNSLNIQDLFDPSGFIYDPNLFIPNY